MTIENQVTNRELSKKLEELGVKQESLWYWRWIPKVIEGGQIIQNGFELLRYDHPRSYAKDERISAFTVAELGEMLPEECVYTIHNKLAHVNYMGNVEPKFQSIFVKAQFENIKPLLHNINKIKSHEVFLYSDKLGMAGQVDCVAEYLGIPSIIDFKTSTKRKEEKWIEKYFLQATAYALMWEEQTGETIPQIVILITGEDGSLDSFIKRKSDYVDRLLEVIQLWKEKNNG